MGDVVNNVESRDVLCFEVVHRLAFLFTKQRNQYVGASNFLLATALDMKHGTLNNALKAKCGMGVGFSLLV